MLIVIRKKATKEAVGKMAKDFDGYIKVVVDVEQKILTGGGERHVDGEQMLLRQGSHQKNLWGGGLDLETKEIDYNSIINLRPQDNNPSRDILSQKIREGFDRIIKELLL